MIKAGNILMQRHTNKTLKSRRVLYVIKDHKIQLYWRQKTSQSPVKIMEFYIKM